MNSKFQAPNSKGIQKSNDRIKKGLHHLDLCNLGIGIYLRFGAWNLGFFHWVLKRGISFRILAQPGEREKGGLYEGHLGKGFKSGLKQWHLQGRNAAG
jgi:hypothetical protein